MWKTHGIIFSISGHKTNLLNSHTYLPTAIKIDDKIKVFFAARDPQNRGRIVSVDFSKELHPKLIKLHKDPILDLGAKGGFDEDGVSPLSIIKVKEKYYMYYIGWQRSNSVRYFLFTGLAVSSDNCQSFSRIQDTPVIGKSANCTQVRSGGCFLYEDTKFKTWYAEQDGSIKINGKETPSYNWSFMDSEDGVNWPDKGIICKKTTSEIFGYGRSAIIKENNTYHAWLSVRTVKEGYKLGYTYSKDGLNWSEISFAEDKVVSHKGESCFASIIELENKLLMFYNGANFGQEGIYFATANSAFCID